MEVRYSQETEGLGLKRGKEDPDRSASSLARGFLKEQQDSGSPPGTGESCQKHRGSAGADPDYCRRILVRGRTAGRSRLHRTRHRKGSG